MRILLTGSSGLIGKHIRNELTHSDHEVITIGRCPKANDYIVDLTDRDAVNSLLSKITGLDCVIHLAARAHDLGSTSRKVLIQQNYFATENLIDAISAHSDIRKIHFILASTTAVLDSNENLLVTPYAESKIMAEKLVIKSGFDSFSILRFAPVFSDKILEDISKRVFVPRTKIKLLLIPSPKYCLCHLHTAVFSVLERVERREKSYVKVICETQLVSQFKLSTLIPSWFFLPFPRFLLKVMGRTLLFSRLNLPMAIGNMIMKVADPSDYRGEK